MVLQLKFSRFVRTGMNEAIAERVTAKGIVWADIEDCAEALMKLVSDDSINGETILGPSGVGVLSI